MDGVGRSFLIRGRNAMIILHSHVHPTTENISSCIQQSSQSMHQARDAANAGIIFEPRQMTSPDVASYHSTPRSRSTYMTCSAPYPCYGISRHPVELGSTKRSQGCMQSTPLHFSPTQRDYTHDQADRPGCRPSTAPLRAEERGQCAVQAPACQRVIRHTRDERRTSFPIRGRSGRGCCSSRWPRRIGARIRSTQRTCHC
jgi:hypothetical protein